MKVAFLGLGAMGSRMAKNILAAGFNLAVWNRSEAAQKPLQQAGARSAKTPKEAAEGADIVIAMVTDDKASERVWTDPTDGALAGMKTGAIAVEMSTLTPAWIAELAKIAAKHSVKLLDAPVSGSLPNAEARQLIVMTGGDADAFELAKPVLSAMGPVHHVGPTGHGAFYKLAVNALMGIQIAGWAEILGLLAKNGVNPSNALNLLSTMPVCSPVATGMSKLMLAHDFAPRFTNALIAKDFRYVQQTAAQTGSRTPISDSASGVFDAAQKEMGAENVTSVIRFYE